MTTRRLVLIRHAKAAGGTRDIDRPLADRGVLDAAAIGQRLKSLDLSPDRVVVSTALRTQQTWEVAAAVQDDSPVATIDPRVYNNTIEDLLAVIRDTPSALATLIVVGHNPSMGELAVVLDDGAGDAAAREGIATSFPTSGVCVFEITAEWSHVDARDGTVLSFARPRG
jgi:phosphohistidine phosphatase